VLRADSFILRQAVTVIALIVQVFAFYLFFRGHNLPGGGFIAGVASGIGVLLAVLARGKAVAAALFPFDPLRLSAWGLAVAAATGLVGLLLGDAFLTHYHYKSSDFPVLGSLYLGTPLLFDLGVYMVVVGVITKVSFVLLDALDGQADGALPAFQLPRPELDAEATGDDDGAIAPGAQVTGASTDEEGCA
jgi:multicomponent Na+:H+ antiporter subunit B